MRCLPPVCCRVLPFPCFSCVCGNDCLQVLLTSLRGAVLSNTAAAESDIDELVALAADSAFVHSLRVHARLVCPEDPDSGLISNIESRYVALLTVMQYVSGEEAEAAKPAVKPEQQHQHQHAPNRNLRQTIVEEFEDKLAKSVVSIVREKLEHQMSEQLDCVQAHVGELEALSGRG